MKIGCILVLFNPVEGLFCNVVSSISRQVDQVYIVDNSKEHIDKSLISDFENIDYIFLNRNIGIAGAQNLGIEYFVNLDFDSILFVDQDSVLPYDLVDNLKEATLLLNKYDYNVGVICPKLYNRQNGKTYKEKYPILDKFSLKLFNTEYNYLRVNSCGSSASLISLVNFKNVGFMETDLFIDGVDNEWCWRAKSKCNLDSFVLENVGIEHQLGEGDKSILWFKIAISSPFRIYYQYRNYILLCKRDYVPKVWKIKNGFKYFVKLFYLGMFVSSRMEYLKNIFKGIKDGVKYSIININK